MIVSHESFLGALHQGYVLKGEALNDWVSSDSDDLDAFVEAFDDDEQVDAASGYHVAELDAHKAGSLPLVGDARATLDEPCAPGPVSVFAERAGHVASIGLDLQGLRLADPIVPTAAVRDEGTSYHYLPPSREVSPSPAAVTAIEATLARRGVAYVAGKTWTTDGFYRETAARIARRRAEGCLTVEMEAAAFFAVAQFRGVTFGQLLYGGDDVSGEAWDSRSWQSRVSIRERLFWLAAEACLQLE